MPQCAVIGCPGHIGQVSPAALSQTVKTKSMTGASVRANSFQLFERRPSVGYPRLSSVFSATGLTAPFGWLPAENARKWPAPSLFRMLSARMERAELPVQRNSTL